MSLYDELDPNQYKLGPIEDAVEAADIEEVTEQVVDSAEQAIDASQQVAEETVNAVTNIQSKPEVSKEGGMPSERSLPQLDRETGTPPKNFEDTSDNMLSTILGENI